MPIEQRNVKCNDCGHIWLSGAMPKNLKCKKCGFKDIIDPYIEPVHTCGECDGFGSEECKDRITDEVACSEFAPKTETREVGTELKCSDCHIYGTECDNTNPADPVCGNFTPKLAAEIVDEQPETATDATKKVLEDAVDELKAVKGEVELADPDLDAAKKDLEAAKATEEDAINKVKEAEAVVKSKEPPPCKRCNGDGFWHSPKTGLRAKTSGTPLVDTSKLCPDCK